ncbi:MAG TPA: hypothetical protein VE569_03645, partial [Acidimicrobiia bacterium]|nr:hypothetical protein [Acidimicrobiia bacterium]
MGTPFSVGGGRWLLSGPIVAILLAGAIATAVFPDRAEDIGFFCLSVGLTTASVLFVRRSSGLPAREGTAWRLVAVGVGLFGLGVVIAGVLTGLGVTLPAFGLID